MPLFKSKLTNENLDLVKSKFVPLQVPDAVVSVNNPFTSLVIVIRDIKIRLVLLLVMVNVFQTVRMLFWYGRIKIVF